MKKSIQTKKYLIPYGYNLRDLTNNVKKMLFPKHNKIVIVTNERFLHSYKRKRIIYGEDYYLFGLLKILKQLHYDFILLSEHSFLQNYNRLLCIKNVSIMFSNVSLVKLLIRKPKIIKALNRSRVLNIVYFLDHITNNLMERMRGRLGISLSKYFVDYFIVTSKDLLYLIKRLLFPKSSNTIIKIIPPFVPVIKHNHALLTPSVIEHKDKVSITYIGTVSKERVDLINAIHHVYEILNPSKISVDIITLDYDRKYLADFLRNVKDRKIASRCNIAIRVDVRYLPENKKCSILAKSDFFITPNPLATMRPSISVLEAFYHGTIPIPFRKYYLDLIKNTELIRYYLKYFKLFNKHPCLTT